MKTKHHVLLCHCGEANIGDAGCRQAVHDGLLAANIPFTGTPDLCRWIAERDSRLHDLADAARLTIIACHPRAVLAMLCAAGIRMPPDQLTILDLRRMAAADILAAIPDTDARPLPDETDNGNGWQPWFPVIDHTRCTNCGQCMNFCLFGVYSRSPEGTVTVTTPQACKTNCPACARICPQVAIMFPKLPDHESPLNGDAITDDENLKTRARVNADALLGDDLYAALAQRRQQARGRLLKTQQERQAEAERAACSRENLPWA